MTSPIDEIRLFDTLHDFGSNTASRDTIALNKAVKCECLNKMIYTLLEWGIYGQFDNLSYLTPSNTIIDSKTLNFKGSILQSTNYPNRKNLEDDIFNKTMDWCVTNSKTDKYEEKFTIDKKKMKTDPSYLQVIHDSIYDFFKDSDDIIPLVIDTSKSVHHILNPICNDDDNNRFAYCLNQELVNDPASKKNDKHPETIKFVSDYYVEKPSQIRTYPSTNSIYHIKLNGMDLAVTYQTKIEFIPKKGGTTESVTSILNKSSNHPNCISQIRKQILALQGKPESKETCDVCVKVKSSNKNVIYNEIYKKLTGSKFVDYMEQIVRIFTQKRLGDQLQVESCLKSIKYLIKKKKNVLQSSVFGEITINKSVFVSIDRMACAYAAVRGVPFILDMKTHYILWKPKPGASFSQNGGSTTSTITKRNSKLSLLLKKPSASTKKELSAKKKSASAASPSAEQRRTKKTSASAKRDLAANAADRKSVV